MPETFQPTQEFYYSWEPRHIDLTDSYVDYGSGWEIDVGKSRGLFILNTSANSATIKLWNDAEIPLAGYAGLDLPFTDVVIEAKNTVGGGGSDATLLLIYRR